MKSVTLLVAPDYPPTNRSSSLRAYYVAHALTEAGYLVEAIVEPPPSCSAGLARPEGKILVRRIKASHRAVWLVKALWHIAARMRHRRPHVIISTCGPFLAHAVAAFAKVLSPHAFWVADYRDLWASGVYYGGEENKLDRGRLRKWCERWVLRPSDLITTVSRGLQENLSRFHGREVLVFHNGYERPDAGIETAAADEETVRICHTGSLYAERSPAEFLTAFDIAKNETPGPARRLRLEFAGPLDPTVETTLAGYTGRADISYLGNVTRKDAYRIQGSCDYCLLIEDSLASMRGVLTGKVFEYIGMRKPIIAFGISPDSELSEILHESGLAAFCGDSRDELVEFLKELMRGEYRDATEPDEARIARFAREEISRAFVSEIDRRRERGLS